jgi:hypothetical protein
MDKNLLEALLYEDESTTLDFKREQYPFEKASDEHKSELLKDILAFANAWRRTEAYILVGVEEVKGGRSIVKGITHHLDEASLQQFVNSKTNRPVSFSYRAIQYEEKQIGVIQIAVQERPIYLKENFGKLSKETIYIRRGSSTGCADPDEIARMGAATAVLGQVPSLDLQFAETEKHIKKGTNLDLQSEVLRLPSKSQIPRVSSNNYFVSLANEVNAAYYQEFADYLFYTTLLRPAGFSVKNTGAIVLHNVRIRIVLPKMDELLIIDHSQYPDPPQYSGLPIGPIDTLRNILNKENVTTIADIEDKWEISAEVGDIQPKADGWSEAFNIGSVKPCAVEMEALVFADELSEPLKVALKLSIAVRERNVSLEELVSIADRYR